MRYTCGSIIQHWSRTTFRPCEPTQVGRCGSLRRLPEHFEGLCPHVSTRLFCSLVKFRQHIFALCVESGDDMMYLAIADRPIDSKIPDLTTSVATVFQDTVPLVVFKALMRYCVRKGTNFFDPFFSSVFAKLDVLRRRIVPCKQTLLFCERLVRMTFVQDLVMYVCTNCGVKADPLRTNQHDS